MTEWYKNFLYMFIEYNENIIEDKPKPQKKYKIEIHSSLSYIYVCYVNDKRFSISKDFIPKLKDVALQVITTYIAWLQFIEKEPCYDEYTKVVWESEEFNEITFYLEYKEGKPKLVYRSFSEELKFESADDALSFFNELLPILGIAVNDDFIRKEKKEKHDAFIEEFLKKRCEQKKK